MAKYMYPAVVYFDDVINEYAMAVYDVNVFADGKTMEEVYALAKSYLKEYVEIALELNMGQRGHEKVREWIRMYELNGSLAFNDNNGKKRKYSKEFKTMVIEDYLSSGLSELTITAKYNLTSCSILREWIKKYNNGEELKTIINNPEVYTMPRVKTTKNERIKIVRYCLDNDSNYALAAQTFGVSYSQVYEWCKKYRVYGEDGLDDYRGKKTETKSNDTTSKNEQKLKDKIKKLENQNIQLEREIEVLKKAYALEMELFQLQGIKKKK